MQVALRLVGAATVSAALYTVALLLPPAGTPFLLLVPLPGLVLAARAPLAECGSWLLLAAGIIALGLGGQAAPGFALLFGLPTVILAVGNRRAWSFERSVLAGVTAWCVGTAWLALLAYGDVDTVVATARAQLAHGVDVALSTYGPIGASDNVMAAMEAERETLVTGLLEILPALVVLSGALAVITNLLLVRRWVEIDPHVNLRLWRTPDALIWGLIASGFGMFVPPPAVAILARNLFVVLLGCYFCQGLAIVSYYLERFRLPRGLRIAGYMLIAVQHIVAAMVLALGIFDLWGNFRRLGSTGPAGIPFHTDGE